MVEHYYADIPTDFRKAKYMENMTQRGLEEYLWRWREMRGIKQPLKPGEHKDDYMSKFERYKGPARQKRE